MASPQPDKYTKISNELYEATMKISLNGYEFRILHAIFRKTYGYNKKEDRIALSQIAKLTGIAKPHVSRSIHSLIEKKIVTKSGNLLGINKNYDEWELPRMVKLPNPVMRVTKLGNKTVTKLGTTKEIYKETITKEITLPTSAKHQEVGKIVTKKRKEVVYPQVILQGIASYYQEKRGIKIQGNEWGPILQAIKSMLMNGRNPDDIKEFIHWLSTHWGSWNIQTVAKRIPEFLAGKLDRETNRVNPIKTDPIYQRLMEINSQSDDDSFRLKSDLRAKLDEKYPLWKFEREWGEIHGNAPSIHN